MTIEVTAKKVDDAINQGLKQLGVGLDDVTVEVLDAGGLFRKAKVRLTLDSPADSAEAPENAQSEPAPVQKDVSAQKTEKVAPVQKSEKPSEQKTAKTGKPASETSAQQQRKSSEKPNDKQAKKSQNNRTDEVVRPTAEQTEKTERKLKPEEQAAAEHAVEFVKNVVAKMGFETSTVTATTPEQIVIDSPAGDDSLIIGRHGETLSALGYLAETCIRSEKCHINVTVDCNGYRDRRAASLSAMARRRANECVAKHRKIKLEVMERADRRTVHNALTDDDRVTTASEGKEPHRYVVIIPR